MRNYLILAVLFTLAACTSQVETNLPEPETMNVTTDDENKVTLRSTQAECDDLEDDLTPPNYIAADVAAYFACRLNQGLDEDYIQLNCTFSEQVVDTACVDPFDLDMNWEPFVDREDTYVLNNSDDCVGCDGESMVWGCRVPIYTVTYLNDTECPGAPNEWQFRVVADVYCCL